MAWRFTDPDLIDLLERADDRTLDSIPFGIIAMTAEGVVTSYNRAETANSGISADRVLGRHFFSDVAPCTNNYMVASRFENEPELDVVIDYIFTLRMRPMAVLLRLLRKPGCKRMYLAVTPA